MAYRSFEEAIPSETASRMIAESSEISAMLEGLRKSILRPKPPAT
jgi:hypothetical protein